VGEGESNTAATPDSDQTQRAPTAAEDTAGSAGIAEVAAVEAPECADKHAQPALHGARGEGAVDVVMGSREQTRVQQENQQTSKPMVTKPEPEEGPPRGGWEERDKLLLIKTRDELPSQLWLTERLRGSTCAKWTRRTTTTLNRVLTLLRGELAQLRSAAEEVLLLFYDLLHTIRL
jgi:hypothetical protein